MKKTITLLLVSTMMLGIASAAYGAEVAGGWWWSVGPAYRGDMEISVSGSSYVQQNQVHAASGSYAAPQGIGDASTYANRVYDDGFVAIDPGTIASGDGLTWYWGYARADQYDANADTLTFSRGGGSRVSVATTLNGALNDDDRMEAWGVEFTAGRQLGEYQAAVVALQAGLGFFWNLDTRFSGSTYAETVSEQRFRVEDVYALDGVVPPAAPYQGTYDGPGPLIPNRPASRREAVTGGTAWRAENDVRIDLDAVMQQLWFGPRVGLAVGSRVDVFCLPFVSLNRLEARYERDEWFYAIRGNQRTTLATWHHRTTDEQLLFGIGIRAGARIALKGPWFVDVAAGIESIETAETTLGPNKACLDLSGYSAVTQVGAAF